MGFCIFNNIALTAFHLQKKWGLKRIAIIDYDVHHGNGTQVKIFYHFCFTLFDWKYIPGSFLRLKQRAFHLHPPRPQLSSQLWFHMRTWYRPRLELQPKRPSARWQWLAGLFPCFPRGYWTGFAEVPARNYIGQQWVWCQHRGPVGEDDANEWTLWKYRGHH